ncbi:MAG: caspase family protein [Elusimicrobiota bacterium]
MRSSRAPLFFALPLLALLCLTGCSIKHVKVAEVSLCDQGVCSPASSKEQLLTRIYKLFRSHKMSEIQFYRSKPKTRTRGWRGVRFWVLTSLPPLPGKISSLRIADVLYIDREKSEIKLALRPWSTVLFIPDACTNGTAVLKVHSPTDIRLDGKFYCTWLVVPHVVKFEMRIDSFDFANESFTAHFATRFAGLTFGGGRGYLRAEFSPPPPRAPTPKAKPQVPPPAPPEPAPIPVAAEPAPPPLVTVEEETLSEFPVLALRTQLEDANGDMILEAGEEVVLKAFVDNKGGIAAENVRIALSGTPELTAAFGDSRELGGVPPKGSGSVIFRGRLAENIPAEDASLRIEVLVGHKKVLAAAKILKVAMRSGAVKAAEDILSEISVDDIPPKSRSTPRPNDAALVVGIGSYREKFIPAVKYATRDAETVARYFENVLGVPQANIKLLTDDMATKSDLEAYLEDWLVRRVKEDSNVYFYYAGHGAPDPLGKEAYLVPYEGHPDFAAKLFPLKRLYSSLKKLKAKRTVVMLDSCFSGTQGRGITKRGGRPLVTTVMPPPEGDDLVILTASSGREISSDYDKVEHGLFTYYLLKGMRGPSDTNRDRSISLAELFQYVRSNVSETASLELNRDQTPTLMPSRAGASPHLDWPLVLRY